MFKILLFIFLLFLVIPVAGITTVKNHLKTAKKLEIKIDSTKIDAHSFNSAAIKTYKNDPNFNYLRTKEGLTFWDNFWAWVWEQWSNFWAWIGRLLEKLFGHVNIGNHAAPVFRVILISLAAIMLVYVIFKLIGIDLLKILKKNQAVADVPFSESIENIHEINFDQAIENALAIKDYRLAVRLLYLRCLKQLNDQELINWKLEKSNNYYLHELKDEGQRIQFQNVTRQFEYVWYGDFPVDADTFKHINGFFQKFKESLL